MGKEGNSHLKSITYSLPVIHPTSTFSWATKITRYHLAGLYMGKQGYSHMKSITYSLPVICPTPTFSWGGISPTHPPSGHPQSLKATKNATELIHGIFGCFGAPRETPGGDVWVMYQPRNWTG